MELVITLPERVSVITCGTLRTAARVVVQTTVLALMVSVAIKESAYVIPHGRSLIAVWLFALTTVQGTESVGKPPHMLDYVAVTFLGLEKIALERDVPRIVPIMANACKPVAMLESVPATIPGSEPIVATHCVLKIVPAMENVSMESVSVLHHGPVGTVLSLCAHLTALATVYATLRQGFVCAISPLQVWTVQQHYVPTTAVITVSVTSKLVSVHATSLISRMTAPSSHVPKTAVDMVHVILKVDSARVIKIGSEMAVILPLARPQYPLLCRVQLRCRLLVHCHRLRPDLHLPP